MSDQSPALARTAVELDALRTQLDDERVLVHRRIAALTRDFGRIVEASRDIATDDEHDPEGQTIAFERAQLITLIGQAQRHLDELDRALERLDAGGYGDCESCGIRIAGARLAVRPATTQCIRCASARWRP